MGAFYTLLWYQQLHWCSSPFPTLHLLGLLSMWRSQWRKCHLNLRSHCLLICLEREVASSGAGSFRNAWWHCGWCAAGSTLRILKSRIRLQALETGHRALRQDKDKHASMGNVLMNRHTLSTLDRKHKSADVEQLGDIRNSAWEMLTHEIWYTFHTAAFSLWEKATV